MRFNPQEVTGSRVRLNYSVELRYDVAGPAQFILNVQAARTARQTIVEELFSVSPECEITFDTESTTGNRTVSFDAVAGSLIARYVALVEVVHRIVDPLEIIAEGPAALPAATLPFIYPSRYCQADLVQQHAWDTFGHIPRGYMQIQAVRDWVKQTLRFQVGTSCSRTTVIDTLRGGVGVCRDFAHTMISYCRALNYPARFVTGVDYGADPALGPSDFHAYVEVFVGGSWFLFEPTGISPITGLFRIGTGRDAADVSFATVFGPVRTNMPLIQVSAVVDPVHGFAAPVSTDLAVATAN